MTHIKLFENWLNEATVNIPSEALTFNAEDIEKATEYIKTEIGDHPGYAFFGEDETIEEFDNLWNDDKIKDALDMIANAPDLDIVNFETLKTFIEKE